MSGGLLTPDAPQLSDADFGRVAAVLYRHCGIHLTPAKRSLVAARLAARARQSGAGGYQAYLDGVLTNPAAPAFADFVDALSTNLTGFFREPHHFDHVRDTLAPRLRAGGRRAVRAWSAGCSTGEEPYSLAMTLHDALPAAEGWDVKILATDLSLRALAEAEAGEYAAARVAPARARGAHRHLCPRPGGDWAVAPGVRAMVRVRYLNLIEAWPFTGPMDVVFCRNVMIYFDRPTRQRLIDRFHACLRPGGLLVVGHSESLTGLRHRFRTRAATIYER